MRSKFLTLCAVFSIIVFAACSPSRYPKTEANLAYKKKVNELAKTISQMPLTDSVVADSLKWPKEWYGTTNFGLRKPNMVIIHHTAQNSCEQTLNTFSLERSQVSAHYVICKDGTLHHMLNDYLRAWHAGNSKWGNNNDVNSSSIGIELDNNGYETFAPAQINTLLGLLATLKKNYSIPTQNFIGHTDIAPTRKIDPNATFPWKLLADSGFGFWYKDTTGLALPQNFSIPFALKIIGYDISKLDAAYSAFRRHFLGRESKEPLTPAEEKVLYALMLRFL